MADLVIDISDIVPHRVTQRRTACTPLITGATMPFQMSVQCLAISIAPSAISPTGPSSGSRYFPMPS